MAIRLPVWHRNNGEYCFTVNFWKLDFHITAGKYRVLISLSVRKPKDEGAW